MSLACLVGKGAVLLMCTGNRHRIVVGAAEDSNFAKVGDNDRGRSLGQETA